MEYYTIHYNERNEPYIIEKNFGYSAKDVGSHSHWTWHITQRGINHLSKDFFGKPQKMPNQISHEQLEDLKTFNMLRRSDGTLIGINPLYPSDIPTEAKQPVQPSISQPKKQPIKPVTPPITPPAKPPVTSPTKPQRGFWAWLKSLFDEW